ncbi:hypothetical protein [Necropsobacter massiliensis]|uniref:hypothetical protein n=1 Tax=Necropsobacter massiliensis TaxID=1400001 RepID=UPI0005963831|nr:hypothetical protein [Necropsobacter massiliensis]
MNKKAKVTLTLSAIAVALGIGAQFYTNYKIDQVLQNFPYSLRDQLTLNVSQQNANFFSRELMFSITDADAQKTDIISTKLTALPFAVTAESELPQNLVRELNKKLKITIDKNMISSKFSVIGDYLQSSISTQFRDLANTSQTLEIDLNFASKTKFMEIQSRLTGFNYDANSKLNGLKTNLTLVPVGRSQYDLADLDLSLNDADIYLLDGDNTHIRLNKLNYSVNKSVSADTYDLNTNLSGEKVYLSDKNRKEDKIEISGLQISTAQNGIPNELVFANILNTSDKNSIDYPKAINLLLDLLFNNRQSEANISITALNVPQQQQTTFALKNANLAFKGNYQDKQNAEFNLTFRLDELNANPQTKRPLKISGIELENNVSRSDLAARLTWLKGAFALFNRTPDNNEHQAPTKDNPEFLTALTDFAHNFNETTALKLRVNSLSWQENTQANGLNLNYSEAPTAQNGYAIQLNGSLEKYRNEQDGLQLSNLSLNLPAKVDDFQRLLPYYICSQHLIDTYCAANLTEQTLAKQWVDVINVGFSITGDISANLDSVPASENADINASLKVNIPPSANDKSENHATLIGERLEQADTVITLTVPTLLLSDENPIKAKLKSESRFWRGLNTIIKPDNQLSRYFVEENDRYTYRFEKNANGEFVNGKPLSQLEQEIEPEQQQTTPQTEEHQQHPDPAIAPAETDALQPTQ